MSDLQPSDPGPGETEPLMASAPTRRPYGAGTTVLVAAMVGFAEALGWERPSPETMQVADSPLGDDELTLHFGHLDPLDP